MLKEYFENIKDIIKEINKSTKDIFIIGDNSSGKSDVLKKLLIEEKEGGNFYFIDSCNRSFKYDKINFDSSSIPKAKDILDHRLKEENFNIKDSFYTDIIELYYGYFDIERLKELLKDFLSIDFDLKPIGEGLSYSIGLFINGVQYENLSNGYQAIVRIFLELLCATSNKKIDTIIIDEINEFLSVKNEAKIFSFLKKEFPNIRFILTTHSADIIADNENQEIIVINNNNYEILDGRDYQSNTDVRRIFNKLYFNTQNNTAHQEIESTLRKFYSLKLMNKWESKYNSELDEIKEDSLNSAQKILLKRIREW